MTSGGNDKPRAVLWSAVAQRGTSGDTAFASDGFARSEACPPTSESGVCTPSGFRPRTPKVRALRGFTLLEVIIVITLIAIFAGTAVMNFESLDAEEVMRRPADELIRMSKQAVRASAVESRPFTIYFDKTGFSVAGMEGNEGGRVELPAEMTMELLRWGNRDWTPADGQAWMFGSNGLCDAIKVRFMSPQGVLEMGFNPLTGSPTDQVFSNLPR